ncbi:ComF family protein [Streptomyces tendae]
MCYSVHDGLESILWRSKNYHEDAWLRLPLGSLLWTFMKHHIECIEAFYGGAFDVHIAMPSHSSTRGGVSHLDTLIGNVQNFAPYWNSEALVKNDASKAGTRRGRIVTDLFTAKPAVNGKRVLLFDDTFTTGGSMASAAHALKRSGAVSVVGLTFGRQLNAEWRDSKDFVASLSNRELEINKCAVHDGAPLDDFELFFR